MSNKNVEWLESQYPKLIEKGILTTENVENLKSYFTKEMSSEVTKWQKIMFSIFGVLGSLLIISGIVLLLARNWDILGQSLQTTLSLVPLVVGQGIALWVFMKKKDSLPWREGSATFLVLALLSSMSLIGSIYNVGGSLDELLFSWSIVIIPVIYLLNSSVAGLCFLVGITTWIIQLRESHLFSRTYLDRGSYRSLFFILLFGLIIPFIFKKMKEDKFSLESVWLSWAATLSSAIYILLIGTLTNSYFVHSTILVTLFALFYILGRLYLENSSIWRNSLKFIGGIGILISSYVWSSEEVYRNSSIVNINFESINTVVSFILMIVLILILGYVAHLVVSKKSYLYDIVFCVAPLIYIISYFAPYVGFALYNLYILSLGVFILLDGIKKYSMSITNIGLIVILWLAILRFSDSIFSVQVKGFAFILAGCAFLVTNIVLLNKKRKVVINNG